MPVFNAAFPILPGKEDEARQFAREALGSHAGDYHALMDASGTTRVTWTLQATPAGSFVLVWFEAADVGAIFERLAAGTGADADWMRGRIGEVLGLDLTTPNENRTPEVILEWPAP